MAKKAKKSTSTTGISEGCSPEEISTGVSRARRTSKSVSQKIGAAAIRRKLRWYYRVKLGNRWVWFPKRDYHIRGY